MIFVSIIALALCGDHLSIIPTESWAQQCTGSSLDIIIIIVTSMLAVGVEGGGLIKEKQLYLIHGLVMQQNVMCAQN